MKACKTYFITAFFAAAALLTSCASEEKTFSDFQQEIAQLSASEQNSRLDGYFEKYQTFPVIAGNTVCFVLKDSISNEVYLSGDMCSWKPDSMRMERISRSSYFFKEFVCPENARLEYKFVTDSVSVLDPRNLLYAEGPFGRNSLLLMPEYEYPAVTLLQRGRAMTTLDTLRFSSRIMNNSREIYYYHHPKAAAGSQLIVFNDGSEYVNLGKAAVILDNLIESEKIPAVNAVFVNPVERMTEYWLDDRYIRMVFRELIPYIKKKYNLPSDVPVSIGGVSLGGLTSLYALKNYNDNLSFIFSQSGALQIDDSKIISILSGLEKITAKIYLSYGTYENTETEHQRLTELLKLKNAAYTIDSFPEGHNWGNWRAHLDRALIYGLRGK